MYQNRIYKGNRVHHEGHPTTDSNNMFYRLFALGEDYNAVPVVGIINLRITSGSMY